MGLFDFARNIGNKLFGSEDEAPQKIKEYIEEENPGVSNLDVSVEDGVATISGQADSAEAMAAPATPGQTQPQTLSQP